MKPTEFKRRRSQLMKMMGKNTIAILPSASEIIRNRDAHFPFRQDSDFLYLTGFNEPDAVMVLMPGRKARRVHPVLSGEGPGTGNLERTPRRPGGCNRDLWCG